MIMIPSMKYLEYAYKYIRSGEVREEWFWVNDDKSKVAEVRKYLQPGGLGITHHFFFYGRYDSSDDC